MRVSGGGDGGAEEGGVGRAGRISVDGLGSGGKTEVDGRGGVVAGVLRGTFMEDLRTGKAEREKVWGLKGGEAVEGLMWSSASSSSNWSEYSKSSFGLAPWERSEGLKLEVRRC